MAGLLWEIQSNWPSRCVETVNSGRLWIAHDLWVLYLREGFNFLSIFNARATRPWLNPLSSHLLDKKTALLSLTIQTWFVIRLLRYKFSTSPSKLHPLPLRPKHVDSLKKSWISAWGFIKFSKTLTLSKKIVGERLPVMWHDYYRDMMWKNE